METAGYIIIGAIAERISFAGFLLAEIAMGAIIYPIYGNWVWGGGWLAKLGTSLAPRSRRGRLRRIRCRARDRRLGGPRAGDAARAPHRQVPRRTGRSEAFPGHNLGYVVIGTLVLIFGWMGFNPGSTFGATDLRIGIVAVNTLLAACVGRDPGHVLDQLEVGQARHLDDVQRHARRPRRHHRALRVRRTLGGNGDRHRRRGARRAAASSSSTRRPGSTTRAARSRCTACAAPGACSPSGCSPTARTASGGTVSPPMRCTACRASSTATPASSAPRSSTSSSASSGRGA